MSESAGAQLQWGVRIPLRDGTHLSATLYLPANPGSPAPAIFAMTPYIAQTHHESAAHYASHGYPFLVVDVRGRGNSDGTFHSLDEAKDGYDVAEWLAKQAYCNGKVAMWGGSYLAYCQWAAAGDRPPHLATIVPVAAACYGVDVPMRKNIFYSYAIQWLANVAGRTSQQNIFADAPFWRSKFRQWFESGSPFKQLDAFIGHPSSLFQEWLSHPQRDAYWDRHRPTAEQYSKLSIPILTITGAYDADQPGALEHYRRHLENASPEARAQHYLVIGPWDHGGCAMPKAEFSGIKAAPASLVDMRALHRQWYAWIMQGGEKPEFLQKNVAYYVLGAETWRYADILEAITARSQAFYLHSSGNPADIFQSGSLRAEPQKKSEPDHYTYDPRDVSLAALESTLDPASVIEHRLVHAAAGKQLVYHSAPFERDLEISGFFKLSLWLAIDHPDTDFRATVYEVALDGSAIRLTSDLLRARHREGLRQAAFIATTEPLRYDFEQFLFVSRQIRKGNRLRLVIGPLHSIYWQRNYNCGGAVAEESMQDARPVTVKLFHDEAHPSVLYIPVGQSDFR